jgi:hypothetical protein
VAIFYGSLAHTHRGRGLAVTDLHGSGMTIELPTKGRQVRVDGALVTVRDADWADDGIIELFVFRR